MVADRRGMGEDGELDSSVDELEGLEVEIYGNLEVEVELYGEFD